MNNTPEKSAQRKLIRALDKEVFEVPPIWMMRQAGRYLPEYRKVRKEANGFLDVCYTPDLAVEVTLQPIRRFGFDAAILFSDILVIPDAMGRDVRFVEGEGPRLDPISVAEIDALETHKNINHLDPVIETVRRLREELPQETTLLGFCGAPWTVATYMIAGRGTPDQAPARLFSYENPEAFEKLLNALADFSIDYLVAQLHAGADAVQIFDSWSGVLGETDFERWCVNPVKRIVEGVRKAVPDARIIGFPKGAGFNLIDYQKKTGVTALGIDWAVPMTLARQLQKNCTVQGNLDPMRLIAGGKALDEGVDNILENLRDGPMIFNLGHGITPQTPIGHVHQMIERVRNYGQVS